MDLLKMGYSGLMGPKGQPQDPTEIVEKLCERVQNCTLIEDRRAAVMGLKSLSFKYQLEVGTKGMPVLIKVLEDDREDTEIVHAALEALTHVCSTQKGNDKDDLGLMFTEIFVKDAKNVAVLLDLLDIFEYHVRYHAVKLLTLLVDNKLKALQEAVLTSPMGVLKLVDVLSDSRDVIRNEGLLLLITLTRANAEIQKIVAFENVFEKLFGIMDEEGMLDGGVIVSDCLSLLHNLLKGNASNQNMFRETGCLQKLVPYFPAGNGGREWSKYKIDNMVQLLGIVRLFVSSKSLPGNVQQNQNSLNKSGLLEPIFAVALSHEVPASIKQEALYTSANLIDAHEGNQDIFSKSYSSVPGSAGKQSALIHLVQVSTSGHYEFPLRLASCLTLHSFLAKRSDAQLSVASSLTLPPDSEEASVGSLIFTALFDISQARRDPYGPWFAADILAHLILGNQRSKDLLLGQSVSVSISGMDGWEEGGTVFHGVLWALTNHGPSDSRLMAALLSLLVIWLHNSPSIVNAFLREAANLQFLIEQINQSKIEPVVQALSALLMGMTLLFNDDAIPSLSRANIQDIIIRRIGTEVYLGKLEFFKDSELLKQSSFENVVRSLNLQGVPSLFISHDFVSQFRDFCDPIAKMVMSDLAALDAEKQRLREAETIMESSNSIVNSFKELIRSQDAEIVSLRATIKELQLAPKPQGQASSPGPEDQSQSMAAEVSRLKQEIQALREDNERLQESKGRVDSAHQKLAAEHEALQSEQNDLFILLAEQHAKIKNYAKKLRDLGQEVDEEDLEEEGGGDDETY